MIILTSANNNMRALVVVNLCFMTLKFILINGYQVLFQAECEKYVMTRIAKTPSYHQVQDTTITNLSYASK